MVVGSGLIASAFDEFKEDSSVIIFASGVSNSGQTSQVEYAREEALLCAHFDLKLPLVYFSTCSVFDQSAANSPYVKHKLAMERLIEANGVPYTIFRLPIVVGRSRNPHTLTNFLHDCIANGKPFELHKNACRYLMGIDEVKDLLPPMVRSTKFHNCALNICSGKPISIMEIVKAFETITGAQANYTEVDKGNCYEPDNSLFIAHQPNYKPLELKDLLSKYYT